MAPHRYTSAELLELRHSALRPGLENAVAKLARNPELGKIIRKKPFCNCGSWYHHITSRTWLTIVSARSRLAQETLY